MRRFDEMINSRGSFSLYVFNRSYRLLKFCARREGILMRDLLKGGGKNRRILEFGGFNIMNPIVRTSIIMSN